MDEFLELVKKLKLPEKGNNFLEELRIRALDVCETGHKDLTDLMSELSDKINTVFSSVKDPVELPVLYFLRAHCHYVEMEFSGSRVLDRAKKDIEKAAEKFRVHYDEWNEWNESLAHCYNGLLHYNAGQLDPCHKELTIATQKLMGLERDFAGTGQYEDLTRIRSQLNRVADHIKQAEKAQTNPDVIGQSVFQKGSSRHRLILQKQREQLQKHYNFLKENKRRIPPTLVAGLFYLYKTLAPSHHSVYREVPEPVMETEKKLYEELLDKIGFFEVIEQLLAQEEEFNPTARREELLEIINQEWDKDIKQESERE